MPNIDMSGHLSGQARVRVKHVRHPPAAPLAERCVPCLPRSLGQHIAVNRAEVHAGNALDGSLDGVHLDT